nr:unnamed protein product [Callosobruchus chinensis]
MKVRNLLYGRNTFPQLYNVCVRQCSKDCFPIPMSTKKSLWGLVKKADPDPILSINRFFLEDKHCQKVNLSMGVYSFAHQKYYPNILNICRDDEGKCSILPSVLEAEKIIKDKYSDKEYSATAGEEDYHNLALKLLFGNDSVALCQKRNATVQTVGGTGSLHTAVQFLNRHFPGNKKVYLSKPTCPLITSICQTANLDIGWYRYYCPNSRGLDFRGCGHDPTGVDLNQEQWCELSEAVNKKKLYPLFDVSNQGLVTGKTDDDAFAVRLFAEQGHSLTAVQSFSRNMGIYSERAGLLTFIASSNEETERLQHYLELIVGLTIFVPPTVAARIVTEVLGNGKIRKMWFKDLEQMKNRMQTMRVALKSALKKEGSVHNWDCITKQKGMFSFTDMTEEEVKKLASEYHVYMTTDGRISVPGLNSKNVGYVAKAMHQVTMFHLKPLKRLVYCIQNRKRSQECSDSPRWWIHLEKAPPDPVMGIKKFFNADKSPNKVDLILGAYRDDKGKPIILNCVREAEKRISKKYTDQEYVPMTGIPEFNNLSAQLLFGPDSDVICNELNATTQTVSGCAHNPTGVDPNQEQWCEISQLVKERQLFALFDVAYQGLATGDFDNDATAFRTFVRDGNRVAVLQSYAKNMGLYGERTGSCTFIADCKAEAERIVSQLEKIIRKTYSSPPIHGSRIVVEILKDEKLRVMWLEEVKMMSERLKEMRASLKERLEKAGSKHNWDHVVNQIGMFCFSKLTPQQVKKITEDYHIYLPDNGRISLAGLNTKNVDYVANAIHEVTK